MDVQIESKYINSKMKVIFQKHNLSCTCNRDESKETVTITLYHDKRKYIEQVLNFSDLIYIWIDIEEESVSWKDLLLSKLLEFEIPDDDAKKYASEKIEDVNMRKNAATLEELHDED